MGLAETDWELDFKQCSFHHIMQVLRVCRFSTFSLYPAFPPCYCPLAFQRQVRRLTYRISSESYPGNQGCVVSCHGAGRFANSISPFFETTPFSHTTFGLYCRVWVVDCIARQAYNVFVIMAPYER